MAARAARIAAGVIATLGGLLIVAGTFLDWVRADIVGEGIHMGSGWSNVSGSVADGPLIAACGALVAVWGAITIAGSITARWVLAGFIASGAATAFVVYEIIDLATPSPDVQTELQIGVWVMVAGCALGLLGALIATFRDPGCSSSAGDEPRAAADVDSQLVRLIPADGIVRPLTGAVGAVG